MSRNLKSPVTGLPLKEIDLDGLKVDVGWKGCGGIWLDGGELEKVRTCFANEAERRDAQALLQHEWMNNKDFDAFLKRRGRRGRTAFARILGVSLPSGVVIKV